MDAKGGGKSYINNVYWHSLKVTPYPPKIPVTIKGETSNSQCINLGKTTLLNSSPVMRQITIMYHGEIWTEEKNSIASMIFLPKILNLKIIMMKHQMALQILSDSLQNGL